MSNSLVTLVYVIKSQLSSAFLDLVTLTTLVLKKSCYIYKNLSLLTLYKKGLGFKPFLGDLLVTLFCYFTDTNDRNISDK
ncbi:MAG: hypothetical protein R3Y35_03610 [Clostridia bacterium]